MKKRSYTNGRDNKMSNYLKKKAKNHKVTHEFSGKVHFFKVESPSGKTHSVSIQVGCGCAYMGAQGVANNQICSHVLATMESIIETGNIRLTIGSDAMKQLKRNICAKLVRPSNRVLNEFRTSTGESKAHMDKKIEVCKRLKDENKHFICEAIFEKGGGRADILVLDTFTAIEIVHTESEQSIQRKRDEYPEGIRIEVIRC